MCCCEVPSRDEWAQSPRGDTVMMAAVRRFLALRNKFTSLTNGLNLYFNSRESLRERTVLRHVGTGLCITLGGFAVVYYQHNSSPDRGHAASLRALISPLPAVAAKDQVGYIYILVHFTVFTFVVYYYSILAFIIPKLLKSLYFMCHQNSRSPPERCWIHCLSSSVRRWCTVILWKYQ